MSHRGRDTGMKYWFKKVLKRVERRRERKTLDQVIDGERDWFPKGRLIPKGHLTWGKTD